jgi:fructose-1,6-bisphosphatase/inositol monophosphatase family enzyme
LYELLAGHDRFVADLRPLAFAHLGLKTSLVCHPYDIATALIAQEAGCVVTAPDGRPLCAPLDTTSAVAWVGYANPALARKLGPLLRRALGARKKQRPHRSAAGRARRTRVAISSAR